MCERGIIVSYETIRWWCLKFGQAYAKRIRSRSPRPGDRWHLDEVFLRINGEIQYRRAAAFVDMRSVTNRRVQRIKRPSAMHSIAD